MIYTRQEHSRFPEEELRAKTEAFKQKLDTSATFLLQEREELFVAQLLKFENPRLRQTAGTLAAMTECVVGEQAMLDFGNEIRKLYLCRTETAI